MILKIIFRLVVILFWTSCLQISILLSGFSSIYSDVQTAPDSASGSPFSLAPESFFCAPIIFVSLFYSIDMCIHVLALALILTLQLHMQDVLIIHPFAKVSPVVSGLDESYLPGRSLQNSGCFIVLESLTLLLTSLLGLAWLSSTFLYLSGQATLWGTIGIEEGRIEKVEPGNSSTSKADIRIWCR